MSVQIAIIAVISLVIGLVAGFLLARVWRAARVRGYEPIPSVAMETAMESDDTRPTLVPFRVTREAGRNLARMSDIRGQELDDQELDELVAELDRSR